MIEERTEIPLEEIDKRVAPNMYMLMKTGGYHPYHKLKLEPGEEHFKKPIWPYVKKLQGYHQHLNAGGKMNGSISAKKPYVNLTVYAPTFDKNGRQHRIKTYFHIIVAKAFCNPNGLVHKQDGGDYVVVLNASKVKVTGNKFNQKKYYSHSQYPGGLKVKTFKELNIDKPEKIIFEAVKGMLPKNKLGKSMLKKLKVFSGPNHDHESQKPTAWDPKL